MYLDVSRGAELWHLPAQPPGLLPDAGVFRVRGRLGHGRLGIDPRREEYERIALAELRRVLDPDLMILVQDANGLRRTTKGEAKYLYRVIEIEEIRLDPSAREHEVVVLLRDLKRPECLFGWRAPAVESGVFENNCYKNVKDAAESHAFVLSINLEEYVLAIDHGLPKYCSPGTVTWF